MSFGTVAAATVRPLSLFRLGPCIRRESMWDTEGWVEDLPPSLEGLPRKQSVGDRLRSGCSPSMSRNRTLKTLTLPSKATVSTFESTQYAVGPLEVFQLVHKVAYTLRHLWVYFHRIVHCNVKHWRLQLFLQEG